MTERSRPERSFEHISRIVTGLKGGIEADEKKAHSLLAGGVRPDFFAFCEAGQEGLARRLLKKGDFFTSREKESSDGAGSILVTDLLYSAELASGNDPNNPTAKRRVTALKIAIGYKHWGGLAKCIKGDPDELYTKGAAQNRSKLICRGCPVGGHCLAHALENNIEDGVWGGMTERERRALKKRKGEKAIPGLANFLRRKNNQALRDLYSK